jgi:hypothetical protein
MDSPFMERNDFALLDIVFKLAVETGRNFCERGVPECRGDVLLDLFAELSTT